MTATPIPRTLMMTAYGDLETATDGKPAGRRPIETRAMPLSRLEDAVDRLRPAIASGARIYWVCPLLEDPDAGRGGSYGEQAALAQRFGDRVGLVHGRLKAADKDAVMARFAGGELDILVATTVIEVGVDVPRRQYYRTGRLRSGPTSSTSRACRTGRQTVILYTSTENRWEKPPKPA